MLQSRRDREPGKDNFLWETGRTFHPPRSTKKLVVPLYCISSLGQSQCFASLAWRREEVRCIFLSTTSFIGGRGGGRLFLYRRRPGDIHAAKYSPIRRRFPVFRRTCSLRGSTNQVFTTLSEEREGEEDLGFPLTRLWSRVRLRLQRRRPGDGGERGKTRQ